MTWVVLRGDVLIMTSSLGLTGSSGAGMVSVRPSAVLHAVSVAVPAECFAAHLRVKQEDREVCCQAREIGCGDNKSRIKPGVCVHFPLPGSARAGKWCTQVVLHPLGKGSSCHVWLCPGLPPVLQACLLQASCSRLMRSSSVRAFNEENGSFLATTYIIFYLSLFFFGCRARGKEKAVEQQKPVSEHD